MCPTQNISSEREESVVNLMSVTFSNCVQEVSHIKDIELLHDRVQDSSILRQRLVGPSPRVGQHHTNPQEQEFSHQEEVDHVRSRVLVESIHQLLFIDLRIISSLLLLLLFLLGFPSCQSLGNSV